MSDDAELLARWRDDDDTAGSELFVRHFDALFRFFVNKVPEDAEDLIQATWMACLRYRHNVEQSASFRAYLFTVARHELYRHLRSKKTQAVDFGTSSMIDLSPSASALVGATERDQRLLGALRSLPVEAQVILELHYWEELTTTELARVLEVPHGTAKTRLRRARQLLTRALQRGKAPEPDDAIDDWVRSMRTKVSGPPTGDR